MQWGGHSILEESGRGSTQFALAELWQSAWIEGDGDALPDADLAPAPTDRLRELYLDRSFLEARWLKDMSFPPSDG